MNILLSSVGRRPYLVRWFQEALKINGLSGMVIAADHDPASPSRAFADDFVRAPSVDAPEYQDWLSKLLVERGVKLAVSINDFELSEWSGLPESETWAPLVRLSVDAQHVVEDKSRMAETLSRAGVSSPRTWSATQSVDGGVTESLVTKGRYGSGSRGLRFTTREGLQAAVREAVREVTTRQGIPALEQGECEPEDLLVVQEQIVGVEYGLDVICDLTGTYAGVLGRRKIAMRGGETDRAVSVDPEAFEQIARDLAEVTRHPGTMDVDVIVTACGTPFVIDINPRFGGGYPFSHLAGANLPAAYVAWATGRTLEPSWMRAKSGVTAAKYVEIAVSVGGDMP